MTKTTRSTDGTRIAYETIGQGPLAVLVDGALCSRAMGPSQPLARLLAPHFTVLTYDRRGRGESGDTPPYAIDREVEDIAALLDAAGGSAHVYGISSGAALALEAAKAQLPIERLAVFEAPFIVDDGRPLIAADYGARLRALIAADKRSAAVRMFMREGVRVPAVFVLLMRLFPSWSKLKAVAHTLAYDTALLEPYWAGKPLEPERWASLRVPTLVMAGGKSPAWMQAANTEIARVVRGARYETLPGQTHMVKPEVLAPVLRDFFGEAQTEEVARAAG